MDLAPRTPEEEARRSVVQAAAVFTVAALLGATGSSFVVPALSKRRSIAGGVCVPTPRPIPARVLPAPPISTVAPPSTSTATTPPVETQER